jgi:hypothetical protein
VDTGRERCAPIPRGWGTPGSAFRQLNERRAELRDERSRLEADLVEVEQQIEHAPNPELLDALPVGPIDVEQLPEDTARRLFEALRLEIHYNKITNQATCRITLFGSTTSATRRAAHEAVVVPLRRTKGGRRDATTSLGDSTDPTDKNKENGMPTLTPVPILVVPSAGLPKDGNGADLRFSTGRLVVEAVLDIGSSGGGA